MSREQSLRSGAGLMVLAALLFLVYAIAFFFRAFAGSVFEVGVPTLNGVTRQQLDELNPAIMGYITHLHVAIAGFIASTAIAAGGLAWYGVRDGLWWATLQTAVIVVVVVGLAVALPMHYMGHFNYNWVSHLVLILRRYHHLCRRGFGGARRANPSGADTCTSPPVDTAARSCSTGFTAPSRWSTAAGSGAADRSCSYAYDRSCGSPSASAPCLRSTAIFWIRRTVSHASD